MDSKLILLKKQVGISALDINKCVICQKLQTTKLTSTKNGRIKVTEAVHIRNDNVLRRLKDPTVEENVKYHMTNACYKSSRMKKALEGIMVGFLNLLSSLFCMFLLFFIY